MAMNTVAMALCAFMEAKTRYTQQGINNLGPLLRSLEVHA